MTAPLSFAGYWTPGRTAPAPGRGRFAMLVASVSAAEDFPAPLREEYASIREAMTWLPGEVDKGTAETTLEAMTEDEAGVLAQRLFSLYLSAADVRRGC